MTRLSIWTAPSDLDWYDSVNPQEPPEYPDDEYLRCHVCDGQGTVNPLTAPKGFFCVGTTTCPICEGTGEAT